MNNKKIKTALVAAMLTSTMTYNIPAISAATLTQKNVDNPVLVPTPKKVTYEENILSVTNSVNIKGKDVADTDAVRELTEFLESNSITVNEEYQDGSTTIIIGEEDDEVDGLDATRNNLGLVDAATLDDEGYVLAVDSDNNGTVLIEGKDGDGTFYGVQTLTQLAVNDEGVLKSKEAKIEDEPTMTTRGSIEGFYGNPWSHQDRLNQIEFYGKSKLNTYIYAPKDDVYHREKWREPYPQNEMNRMNELIETSKQNKVDFVFALSPGIDIQLTGTNAEADYQALVNKCQAMYDMGVRSFAIFFDDIKNKQGTEQANLLNRFNKEFIQAKGDITPLITVPTEYDTNAMSNGTELNAYTKNFSETLDPSIKVLWTGTAVVPEGIDIANAEFIKSIYGERVGIWWNYPVTDYITDKLGLGPVYGLDKGLANELDFLVMNPMEHADLSKISLSTGADYSWNTEAYDYDKSFKDSITNIYGDLAPYMYTFANHSTRLVAGWASTGRADAPDVRALMDEFIKKNAKGEDVSVEIEALTSEFNNMILAADKLQELLPADQLSHCNANLNKLRSLGENDKLALELFIAYNEGDDASIASLKRQLNAALPSLKSGKKVSELTALEFINKAVNYNPDAVAGFEVSNTFVTPGQEIQLTNTSSVSSTDLEWTFEGANIETSTEENPVISYAKEGVYTISLKAKNKLGEDEEVKTGIITVSNEANNEIINLSKGKKATATSYTGASEAPEKAIDGITSTKWCATGYNRPHTLYIDLGQEMTVTNVTISHAEIGGEGSGLNTRDYRIEVSKDGNEYVEVANVKGNVAGLTSDNVPVSIARYVKLIVDTPTQGGDSAARIYEVEVNGLEKAITLPPIYVEEADKTTLKIALDLANAITDEDLANVVPVVVEEFKAALQQAKDVYDNVNATQAKVNQAFDRLAEAMHMLNFVKGDKTALKAFIDKVSGLEAAKYTEATWTPFNDALKAATSVYEDVNAMQEEVNTVYNDLVTAFLNLRLIPNKNLLKDLINQAEGLESANYTKATFDGLTKALNEAKVVFDNPNATQKEVDNAKDVLEKAISGLQTVTVDNTVKTPVSNGDTTKSVKTGDDVNMLGTLGLISSLGVIAYLKKKKEK
ncbi:beta-N-acetylglucosaminidase domain-containing protein [Thomasclavelia sp.]|uniref:beta-N-acetylglucosaminidase domain-containing protein n=1 Tax=Thomasclavelia sp. TaxID=3025757 RepID=UPI00260C32FF|nr:beta-N-acetylglucosaminidase domain-containing protein [Thomasclavelia sp.]